MRYSPKLVSDWHFRERNFRVYLGDLIARIIGWSHLPSFCWIQKATKKSPTKSLLTLSVCLITPLPSPLFQWSSGFSILFHHCECFLGLLLSDPLRSHFFFHSPLRLLKYIQKKRRLLKYIQNIVHITPISPFLIAIFVNQQETNTIAHFTNAQNFSKKRVKEMRLWVNFDDDRIYPRPIYPWNQLSTIWWRAAGTIREPRMNGWKDKPIILHPVSFSIPPLMSSFIEFMKIYRNYWKYKW